MENKILLVGVGSMSYEYVKVLNALAIPFVAVGRGEKSANEFKEKTGHEVFSGGIEAFLNTTNERFEKAIVTVNVASLSEVSEILIRHNIKEILLEKPGGETISQIISLAELANDKKANVLLAYNRRFYGSVLEAEKIIKEDGGVQSFHFEFTEWIHVIEAMHLPKITLANLFLNNSSHVVDLAFFLGGAPAQMSCYQSGELSWHPSGAVFSGAGITSKNALFSYQANWNAPGRWSVELCTKLHRLYFRPLEALQIQEKGTVQIIPFSFDNSLDTNFKPGLYLQTKNFIEHRYERFCTIQQQATSAIDFYQKIAGYSI